MRGPLITGALVLATTMLAATAALACGDKLMLLTRGARFRQVHPGAHAASILAYTRQNSAVPAVVRELELQPALKKAGHKLQGVEDPTKLDEALKTGKYDLVLADVADAEGLEQQARSAPSRPMVLPVIYKPTKAERTATRKKFRCVLKAPGNTAGYLAAIDEAMELKLKTAREEVRR